jgi:regulator of protease activity HflC (stomatin/prohibitin superfamily)
MFEIGVVVGALLCAIWVLFKCLFRVEEGHVAVLVAFGKADLVTTRKDGEEKRALRTYRPGLHWKKPWQRVVDVSMKEQTLDLGTSHGSTAMAADGTILRLDPSVRYVPVESELYEHLFDLERPVEHITGLFTCLLRNEIAQAGSYALIRRERRRLNERIETFCRERIVRYGVRFNAVDLADIMPPDELADALNAVIQAHSEAEALFHRTEAAANQRILAAERGLAIATARAQAIEIEIDKLASFLSVLEHQGVLDAYVARRRSEVTSESRTLFLKEGAVR